MVFHFLSIVPPLPEDTHNKLCDQIINMLDGVGIRLTRRNEVAQATALRIARFNSPIFLMSFAPPQPHADNVITLLLGTRPEFAEGKTTLPFQGGFNFGRYSNSRIDNLLPILVGEMDQDLRLKAMTEALRIHRQEVGYIPLYRPSTTWAARQEVSVYLSGNGGIDLRSIRIEKK
jgi:peptide/nickel transport system substrate-binding protein